MIARKMELTIRPEKFTDFKTLVEKEILPILKRQPGFLEALALHHEIDPEKVINITLWKSKTDVENYHRKEFPRIQEMMKPYLHDTGKMEYYTVEGTVLMRTDTAAA